MENNINTTASGETTHTINLSDKLYKVMLGVLGLGAIFVLGYMIIQFRGLPQNNPHDISVSGEGKVYAKPDVAMISFGAHTEAAKSQDAVSQNNQIMNAVTAAIKELGIEEKDIQTTMYNLQPIYEYGAASSSGAVSADRATPMIYPVPPSGQRVFKGYALDQQIQVKIRNFDNINAVLEKATTNGANTVGQLYFTVDDMEKVRAEAREKAIAQAKEKAKSMFAAAGLRGARLVNISEGYAYPYYGGIGGATLEKAADAVMPAPSVQPGQMEINTTVTLIYRAR